MTPNKEQFTTYKSGNFGSVYNGNDKACVVVGMGRMQIAMDDGGVRMLCEAHNTRLGECGSPG